MRHKEYTLQEMLVAYRRWNNVTTYDMVTKYLNEAAKDKDTFIAFIKQMKQHYPDILTSIILSANNSIYPIKDLFVDVIPNFPDKNLHRYGSVEIGAIISQLKKYIQRGYIFNKRQLEKLLYQAHNSLSSADYLTLLFILQQKLPQNVCDLFDELINENKLSEAISVNFRAYYNFDTNYHDYNDYKLFNKATENVYNSDKFTKYIISSGIVVKLGKNIEFVNISECSENLQREFRYFIKYTSENIQMHNKNIIVYMDDKRSIGYSSKQENITFKSDTLISLNEPQFDAMLISNFNIILIIGEQQRIIRMINEEQLEEVNVTAKSFEKLSADSLYSYIQPFKIITEDTEIVVRTTPEIFNSIGKNTKKFKLYKFNNNFYFRGK